MIVKTINQEFPNKRAAIQFLGKEVGSENGVVYMELTKLLRGSVKANNSIIYQYKNCDNTQTCSIKRKTNYVGKKYTYIVNVCNSININ